MPVARARSALAIVAAILFAGVIADGAVAYAFLRAASSTRAAWQGERTDEGWPAGAPQGWPRSHVRSTVVERNAGCVRSVHWADPLPGWPDKPMYLMARVEAGWPLPSWRWIDRCAWAPGAALPSWFVAPRPLDGLMPTRPRWPGFPANAALYGAAIGLLVAGLLRVRRMVIRFLRAGRCRACGYDLAGLPPAAPCPECGAAPRETGGGL